MGAPTLRYTSLAIGAAVRIAPGADGLGQQPARQKLGPYGNLNMYVHYATLRACGPACSCLSDPAEVGDRMEIMQGEEPDASTP